MSVKNKVQLITYPDALGGNIRSLDLVLQRYFNNVFEGGIHILPPYPSSGDRGFAPITYMEIDPSFGNWGQIREMGESRDIIMDLMVNHISRDSAYFRDFLKNGKASVYADLFITLDKVWPDGKPVREDIDRMFLRREVPYSMYPLENGKGEVAVWTTFGKGNPSEQIDIDVESEVARTYLKEVMTQFQRNNVKIVRLDAIGYVVKKAGTSCFFVDPEVFEFLDWMAGLAETQGIELLPEVHSHYAVQRRLAEKGYWIYDFVLPFLILDALIARSGKTLCEYLARRPEKQFTMLDCHDGIPVKPDLDDLVSPEMARKTVDVCCARGANLSLIVSDKYKGPDGFDVHQIRGTIYSLLDGDDDAYLLARAIQFFTPGIPQVYYMGLLAGENDRSGAEEKGDGREVNRHNYSLEEIGECVRKPVVMRLVNLIRFRNTYPAFQGSFQLGQTGDTEFSMKWKKGNQQCSLKVNLAETKGGIHYLDQKGNEMKLSL